MPLTIRPEQMRAFEAHAREKFCDEAVRILRRKQPAEAAKLGDPGLRTYVVDGVAQAEETGLKADENILQFLEIGLLPEAFRHQPLVQEVISRVMANDEVTIVQRVAFLHGQLVPRAAEEAAAAKPPA